MAQRLDEAFAGCDEWTVIAVPKRRSTPTAPRTTHIFDGAELLRAEDAQSR